MKISMVAVIVLVIGVTALLFAGLGMTYLQRSNEQIQLTDELELAQLRFNKYPLLDFSSQREELENKLAQTESQISTAKAGLYQSLESIEAGDALFKIAENCNVEITGISSSAIRAEKLEKVTLSALSLTVKAQGEVLDLIAFVNNWTKEYHTGVVKSVEISVPQIVEQQAEVQEEGGEIVVEEEAGQEEAETVVEKPSAVINLVIYNYEDK